MVRPVCAGWSASFEEFFAPSWHHAEEDLPKTPIPPFKRALSVLNGDELEIVFLRLCNPFDPRVAMAFSSASRGLWAKSPGRGQKLLAYERKWAKLG